MLAVSGAFPVTSDQPPVAVVSPSALMTLVPGWGGNSAVRALGGVAPSTPQVDLNDRAPVDELWSSGLAKNPFAIAGPPPSFEANVLEVERRFEAILARIELARTQREMRVGIGPENEAKSDPAAAPDETAKRSESGEAVAPRSDSSTGAEIIRFSPMTARWRLSEIDPSDEARPRMAIAV